MTAEPMRVAVVDDEALARRRMARLLRGVAGVTVVAELDSAEALLTRLASGDLDAVLLDVQMPGMTGIEAVLRFPEDAPYVIFATAHAEHAIAAFEVGAVDYLLKPIDEMRLEKAIARARQRLGFDQTESAHPAAFGIDTQRGVEMIQPRAVSHVVLDGALTRLVVHEATVRSVLTELPLAELARRLGDGAERVHRRALVNFAFVERLESLPTGGYLAHMRSGEEVEVSRQSARRIRRRLASS